MLIVWRLLFAAVLIALVGMPALLPVFGLAVHPEAWKVWADYGRLRELLENTATLVGGTLVVSVPFGILLAALLYRSDLPGRRLGRSLALLSLLVPLPLIASAWQATLGAGGWLAALGWTRSGVWQPWSQGMGPAIWIHGLAALPWVILIVGQGLRWVEPEIEEDALLHSAPWTVFTRVTLVRCRAAIGAAALWVAVLVTTEISVTDVMQVRTFAEEFYTQFVLNDRDAVLRCVSLMLPLTVAMGILLALLVARIERCLPDMDASPRSCRVFPLGKARWPIAGAAWLGLVAFIGVPVASLVWKAGLTGSPLAWSAPTVWEHLTRVGERHGVLVGQSLSLASLSGVLSAGLALLLVWLAMGSRWFLAAVLAHMALLWTLPAPVLGFGLKETIQRLLDTTNSTFLDRVLYSGPSLAPVAWAQVIRLLPFAVAILWPIVRLMPKEFTEAAYVEGACPAQVVTMVYWPLCKRVFGVTALATGVLALGELGAGKLVETPGTWILSHEIFRQMHYGVTNDLAALCLILLGFVGIGGAALVGLGKLANSRPR